MRGVVSSCHGNCSTPGLEAVEQLILAAIRTSDMAFFNLTLLGPQEPIKSSLRKGPETPDSARQALRLTTPISTVRTPDSTARQSPAVVAQARTDGLTYIVPAAGRPTANSTLAGAEPPTAPAYSELCS